jgi:ADP-ribose pyrophosphatase
MKIISSKETFKTKIFTVREVHATDPSGFEIRRMIVGHGGSAVMMPVDERGRILLVKQFRLPAEDYLWEIPAGRIDEGETALQAAKRELQEETGYKARRWTKLLEYFPSPGYLAEKMTLFVAQDLTEGQAEPMEDERIEVRWFTPKELDELVRGGKMRDGKTMLGWLAWKDFGRPRSPGTRKRV